MIKTIKNFVYSLLSEDGKLSTKRFVGIITTLFLCGCLFWSLMSKDHKEPPTILVECITALAIGALGISATQTIFKKKDKDGSSEKTNEKNSE
jgi:hypothetical protein